MDINPFSTTDPDTREGGRFLTRSKIG